MSICNWKNWFTSKNWIFKWFIILILLRPFIDIFWDYKNKFVFISPLQITGVLTFVLVLLSFLKLRKGKLKLTKIDWAFFVFGFLLLLNGILIFLKDPESSTAGIAVKLAFPFYLYFYLRFFIKEKKDFDGILQTFLFSAIIPLTIFLYELIVHPISPQIAAGRPGDLPRYVGLYADVSNYSIYFLFGFLISGYFFLSAKGEKSLTIFSFLTASLIFLITIGIFYLSHYTTYVIFIALIILFFFFSFRFNKYLSYLFLFLFLFTGVVKYKDHIKSNLYPLFQIDLLVLNGKTDVGRIFNGRGFIWEHGISEFNKVPLYAKLFGVNLAAEKRAVVTAGAHDDFLRILFAAGIVGFLSYISILFFTLKNSLRKNRAEKYIIFGTVLILVLYSVALTPTFYYPVMYVVLSVIAWEASRKVRKESAKNAKHENFLLKNTFTHSLHSARIEWSFIYLQNLSNIVITKQNKTLLPYSFVFNRLFLHVKKLSAPCEKKGEASRKVR